MPRTHLVLALLALAACSIDDPGFVPGDPDAAGDPDGGAPDAPVALRLVVSADHVELGEATAVDVEVGLNARPPSGVLVTLTSSDPAVTLVPAFMLFEPEDDTATQTVSLSAPGDDDVADETARITLASSEIAESAIIDVDVDDDDQVALVVSPSPGLDVGEGATAQLEVSLTARPVAAVEVAITGGASITVTPPVLTFMPEDWDEPQDVDISGVDDVDIVDDSAVVTLALDGAPNVTIDVTVVDDDPLGIAPSTTSLGTLTEGTNATIGVRLTQQPPGQVAVTVSTSDDGAVGIDSTTLTFLPSNWNVAQPVLVSAVHDDDTADEDAMVTLRAPGVTDRVVSVAVDDVDVQAILVTPASLSLTEGGSGQLGVRLAYRPAGAITLSRSTQNSAVATVPGTPLVFLPGNYATAQTVTVNAPHDDNAIPGSTMVTLESLAAGLSRSVNVGVTDDDVLEIRTSAGTVNLDEGGTASFDVRLAAQPTATITIAVTSDLPAKASVSAVPLQLTTGNWNSWQTVVVTGVHDQDLAGHTVPIRLTSPPLPAVAVDAVVTDDDVQAILFSPTSLAMLEGTTATVGVSLRFMPAGNVTVSVGSTNPAAATAGPAMLQFTPGNHATAQDVLVTAVHDANAIPGSATIQLGGPATASVGVTVTDDDVVGIVPSTPTVTLGEAGSGFFDVHLAAQPTADVTVSVSAPAGSPITLVPAARTFTPGGWNTNQRFTINGVDDPNLANETIAITVSSPGLMSQTVTATVTDDDAVLALASLGLSAAGVALTNPLTPAFAPGTTAYSANVGLWLQRLQITATPQMGGVTLTINGVAATPGAPSAPVELALGVTSIPIVVSAPGGAQVTYTLDVTRGVAAAQQAYLKASNTAIDDGFTMGMAMWGDTLVVGAPQEDSNAIGVNGNQADNTSLDSGAVYVFVRSGSSWIQQAYLKASNTEAGDRFGGAVAIHGDTIVVGAAAEDSAATGVGGTQTSNSASNSGAVYVFTRSGSAWTQQAYLKASNTGAGDAFGAGVTLWGDTLAVGAETEDSSATGINGAQTSNTASSSGAAYVFTRSGTTWSQQTYIKASNTDAGDQFGEPLVLWGDTLVIGADLEDSAATGVNGDQTSNAVIDSGAAYVFTRTGAVWSQQAYLKASNPDTLDTFGFRFAFSGDTIAVGARTEDSAATGVNGNQADNTSTDSGAVYVFARTGTAWSQQAYLKASNTEAGDGFGGSVAAWGDVIAVRAHLEDSAATGVDGNQADNTRMNSGAVYVFLRTGTAWTQRSYLKTSNADVEDQFGDSVLLWGDTLVAGCDQEDSAATGVGGNQADNSAMGSGAAYGFR